MNLVGRAAESRDKTLKDITGRGFSSSRYARDWKTRLDGMLEHIRL
jgi:hypothetical protein